MPTETIEPQAPTTPVAVTESKPVGKPTSLTSTPEPATGDWRSDISDEQIRGNESLSKFKSKEALAKGYIELERKISAKGIVIPGPNSTPEELTEYRTKMGIPESPDKYEMPQDMPTDVQFDNAVLDEFKNLAHKTGMSKAMVAEAVKWQANKIKQYREQQTQAAENARKEALGGFRKELGHSYDESMALAKKAVNQFGGDEFKNFLNETGMGDDPRFVKAFIKIGKALASDSIHGDGVTRVFVPTPDDARRQIAELENSDEFKKAVMSRTAPNRSAMLAKRAALYEAASPAPQVE